MVQSCQGSLRWIVDGDTLADLICIILLGDFTKEYLVADYRLETVDWDLKIYLNRCWVISWNKKLCTGALSALQVNFLAMVTTAYTLINDFVHQLITVRLTHFIITAEVTIAKHFGCERFNRCGGLWRNLSHIFRTRTKLRSLIVRLHLNLPSLWL